MRSSVRKRGDPGTWEYRLELGLQPAQRCLACRKVYWIDGRPLKVCAECGGELTDKVLGVDGQAKTDKHGRPRMLEVRRQRTKGGFRTQKAAQKALDDAKTAVDKGEFVEPSRMTVAEYLAHEWLPSIAASVRPSTYISYQTHVECYLVPRLGTIRLQQLSAEAIGKCYRDLLEDGAAKRPKAKEPEDGVLPEPELRGLSPMTVRHTHAVLHRALRDAVRTIPPRLTRNPADAVQPPQVNGEKRHEMKTWTGGQVKTFLAKVDGDRLAPLWRLLVSTGMRRGEACGLRWEDVDLQDGRLTVSRALVSAGYKVSVQAPKTQKGRRALSLDAATIEALKRQAAQQGDDSRKWAATWVDTSYVFTREDGQPLHPDRVSKLFDDAVKAATVPRIRLHDLRHTWATLALKAGVHPKVVQETLGHANISITLDTYTHSDYEEKAKAATLVAALFAATT